MAEGNTAYESLEERIDYRFRDRTHLVTALTHPSYTQQFPDAGENNQRLEFLGDSVLGLILAEALFETFPKKREGVLTRGRSALAKGSHLADLARSIGIAGHLRLGDGEDNNRGRERDSILEDAIEALIGAIYRDSDLPTARRIVLGWYGDLRERLEQQLTAHNPKGALQELLQPRHGNNAIAYEVVGEHGPDHSKAFVVEARILGEVWGRGEGSSKKEAEENAARVALERWQARDGDAAVGDA